MRVSFTRRAFLRAAVGFFTLPLLTGDKAASSAEMPEELVPPFPPPQPSAAASAAPGLGGSGHPSPPSAAAPTASIPVAAQGRSVLQIPPSQRADSFEYHLDTAGAVGKDEILLLDRHFGHIIFHGETGHVAMHELDIAKRELRFRCELAADGTLERAGHANQPLKTIIEFLEYIDGKTQVTDSITFVSQGKPFNTFEILATGNQRAQAPDRTPAELSFPGTRPRPSSPYLQDDYLGYVNERLRTDCYYLMRDMEYQRSQSIEAVPKALADDILAERINPSPESYLRRQPQRDDGPTNSPGGLR